MFKSATVDSVGAKASTDSSPFHRKSDQEAFIQPKLNIGKPRDKYEVEADRVADQVLAKQQDSTPSFFSPTVTPIQKQPEEEIQEKCLDCEKEENLQTKENDKFSLQKKSISESITTLVQQQSSEEEIQEKCSGCEKEENVQTKENDNVVIQEKSTSNSISPLVHLLSKEEEIQEKKAAKIQTESNYRETGNAIASNLNSSKGGGSPLSMDTKSEMESGFGSDFNNVRVHTDANAVQMNKDLGAQAFTNGNDIYFNEGKYNTNTTAGQHLLAHELTHTLQQGGGATPKLQRYSMDEFADDVSGTVRSAGEALSNAGEAIVDAASDSFDWLATDAGRLATSIVAVYGGSISITSSGISVLIPRICLPQRIPVTSIKLPEVILRVLLPWISTPSFPLSGRIGLTASISPELQIQLGTICLEKLMLMINPFTGSAAIGGGISVTNSVALSALIKGSVRGELGIVLSGIPSSVLPVIGVEGGLSGLIRGIGVSRETTNAALSYHGGVITATGSISNDIGLGADFFAGAYASLDVHGINVCEIFFQLKEWHDQIAASFNLSAGLTASPFGIVPIPPSFTVTPIPFSSFPLSISRDGFKNSCPFSSPALQPCKPANNRMEAELLYAYASQFTHVGGAIGVGVLWASYFNRAAGIPRPLQTFGLGSPVANGFTSHHRSAEVEKEIAKEAAVMLRGPLSHLVPATGTKVLPISAFFPGTLLFNRINNETDKLGLKFDNPFTIPGSIAGGVGRGVQGGGPPGNTSFDQDQRNVGGSLEVWRDASGSILIHPRLVFYVHDTVDFCPGNLGGPFAHAVTMAMSVLEATEGRFGPVYAADVPFDVAYDGPGIIYL